MRTLPVLTLSTLLFASIAVAHEPAKAHLSPKQQVEYRTDGKTITIDYSAPSKRGRTIMGDLVPYGKVWRTGANAATTLTTDADLMIGSLHVPAGKYTLFTIPGEKEWTLIVNKQTGQPGTTHDPAQDLGRVKMTLAPPLKDSVEQFAVGIGKTLSFTWEHTKVWIPVIVH